MYHFTNVPDNDDCDSLTHSGLVESSGESQWELLSVVDNTQLGSQQRMVGKVKFFAQQSKEERGMMGMERRQLEGERDRAREEKRELEGERDKAREEKRELEGERERERVELQQARARANELQRRLEEVERREHEKSVVQEQAIAAEQRGPSWEVMEEELEETDETLGIGGWAVVKVAKLKVAAKCLHSQLVYDYHRRLFRREMDVAARVSHPNLLRFLGARLEGGMAILTEFMPTSLRALVNRRPRQHLPLQHLLSIAVDVARALNYLHNMTPDPIIHRDLSSANVLLQPSPDGGWLAKVSDYGTANFQSQLRSENPGSPVYTAPESFNPALQSPKMDIFSFGVLLVVHLRLPCPRASCGADGVHPPRGTVEPDQTVPEGRQRSTSDSRSTGGHPAGHAVNSTHLLTHSPTKHPHSRSQTTHTLH